MSDRVYIMAHWKKNAHGSKWAVLESQPDQGRLAVEGQDTGEFEEQLLKNFPPNIHVTVCYDGGQDWEIGPGTAPA